MKERLQKVMAELGVASRRKCEELITAGRVKVNSQLVTELGFRADKSMDVIEVDGIKLQNKEKKVYVLLNKPVGYITSVKDQFDRPTVIDLVKDIKERVFPVGRLDYDTEGLLLLTNDGELTYRITHPKHNIDKTYTALVRGTVTQKDIEIFSRGIRIDNYITSPAKLEVIDNIKGNSLINITIHEGKNRQVRRMCSAIGHEVITLKRISIGELFLGDLQRGKWRMLNDSEVEYLYTLGGELNDNHKKC
ncbi:MAG: pseudouridine synthase [Bacillota bacterium]